MCHNHARKHMLRTIAALWLAIAFAGELAAQTSWTTIRLEDVEFSARLIRERSHILSLLGDDLEGDFLLIEMKAIPLYNTVLDIERTDFVFRSRADNERSDAQSPDRIAGSAVLSLETKKTGGGGVFSQSRDPLIVGGAPGTGTRPRRLDTVPSTAGSGGSRQTEQTLSAVEGESETLHQRLTRLEMPLTGTDDALGYLYFQVSPKAKLKRFELSYDGAHGEFNMKFEK